MFLFDVSASRGCSGVCPSLGTVGDFNGSILWARACTTCANVISCLVQQTPRFRNSTKTCSCSSSMDMIAFFVRSNPKEQLGATRPVSRFNVLVTAGSSRTRKRYNVTQHFHKLRDHNKLVKVDGKVPFRSTVATARARRGTDQTAGDGGGCSVA